MGRESAGGKSGTGKRTCAPRELLREKTTERERET